MNMKRIVFWLDSLSLHQSALIRSVASIDGIEVLVVTWDEIDPNRRGAGWHKPDFGNAKIIMKPSRNIQSNVISTCPKDSIHIFGGIRSHKGVYKALCESLASSAHIGIQSETCMSMGVKGLLRLARSKYDALRLRQRINLILGIGEMGVEWFERSSYAKHKIYPFAYFTETPLLQTNHYGSKELAARLYDLIFIGQLIPRKGWDILLHALSKLNSRKWYLHVVGDGKDKERFLKLCAELRLANSVRFHGALPNRDVTDLLLKCDLLVLPSRWDGWGAVVNEALMCGVPVVCSNKCGAADLLDGNERGEVFVSESIEGLSSILARRISQGKRGKSLSHKIKKWSNCISGESAADYLLSVINASMTGGDKPLPPWY